MDQFCGISGDVKPLHTDAEFAKSKDFPGRVTYGMMVSSLYSRLAGSYLPCKKVSKARIEAGGI